MRSLLLIYGSVFACAAVTAAIAAALTQKLAPRIRMLDQPGGRKAHGAPTALLGGVAVWVGWLAPIVAGLLVLRFGAAWVPGHADVRFDAERAHALAQLGRCVWLVAGASLALAVGLIDDRFKDGFPWWAKLGGQFAAAGLLVTGGARLDVLVLPWLNVGVSVLWIVTIINAMNFLDHADGVTTGVAAIACALLAAVGIGLGQYLIALLAIALLGALLGFLPWNLLMAYRDPAHAPSGYLPLALPLLVLGLPLFDMVVVLSVRLREGRPMHRGDRNHLHHRLVRLGMSTRQATFTVYLATAALGLGAVLLPHVSVAGAVLLLLQAIAAMGLIAALMLFGAGQSEHTPRSPADEDS
jgi:UDP-GlcNAc:undecaprenyl-phosphate GlcNAc-1-phosphate transferase